MKATNDKNDKGNGKASGNVERRSHAARKDSAASHTSVS